MPKYLISIVENEDAYIDLDTDSADFAAVMQMHGDFTESVSKAGGEILGGSPPVDSDRDLPSQHPYQ